MDPDRDKTHKRLGSNTLPAGVATPAKKAREDDERNMSKENANTNMPSGPDYDDPGALQTEFFDNDTDGLREPTEAEIGERRAKMSIFGGVVQRPQRPASPIHGPDDREYPLPAEVPLLDEPAASTSNESTAYDPDNPRPLPHVFHRILQHTYLTQNLASQLDVDSLVNLYSISRPFRAHLDCRWTHMIKSWALANAPINWHISRFHFFRDLCRPDPTGAESATHPGRVRLAPTFRYLRCIAHREKTITEIVRHLARHGHRLPSAVKVTLAKMWLVFDLSDSARRMAAFNDHDFWTNEDLLVAHMFLLKLEMRMSDPRPLFGGGRSSLVRNLLFSQKGLTPLARFLKREILLCEADFIVMMAEWKFRPLQQFEPTSFLGMPIGRVGHLDWEHGVEDGRRLIQVDNLIKREVVKRHMGISRYFTSMVLYGYVDKHGNSFDAFLKDDEDENAIDDWMEPIVAPIGLVKEQKQDKTRKRVKMQLSNPQTQST